MDCRTYYCFAIFAVILLMLPVVFMIVHYGIKIVVLSVLGECIHCLIQYGSVPDLTHWVTNAQTHITGSFVLAFFMFWYSSSLRTEIIKPWRAACPTPLLGIKLADLTCSLAIVIDTA
ncbi:hypothetical protein B0H34DRAFT_812098 [Crassisporium funariophilum]|nr:hypothetical protein B0H34DRAFT_812098 [Crassisporium funariophilum]